MIIRLPMIIVAMFAIIPFQSLQCSANWENPWKSIYIDKSSCIFIDSESYLINDGTANIKVIVLKSNSDEPYTLQARPIKLSINCESRKIDAVPSIITDDIILDNLFNVVCDFSESERLALYKSKGVKTNDLYSIETFEADVPFETHYYVDTYILNNLSNTPLPVDELKESLSIIDENLFSSDNGVNEYQIRKNLPKKIILESNPKYSGWSIGWIFVGPDEFYDIESSRYIRINELYYSKDVADLWTLNVQNDSNYSLARQKIDCRSRRIKISDLQIVKNGDYSHLQLVKPYDDWISPPPSSGQYFLMKELCSEKITSNRDIYNHFIGGLNTWSKVLKSENIKLINVPKKLYESID